VYAYMYVIDVSPYWAASGLCGVFAAAFQRSSWAISSGSSRRPRSRTSITVNTFCVLQQLFTLLFPVLLVF